MAVRKLLYLWGVAGIVCLSFSLSANSRSLILGNYYLAAATSNQSMPEWKQQVQQIDEKIAVLKKWQEGYQLTAERANFKANRLQFREDQLVDSRRLWQQAEQAEQKAKDIQVLIDDLEKEKKTILEAHGQNVED